MTNSQRVQITISIGLAKLDGDTYEVIFSIDPKEAHSSIFKKRQPKMRHIHGRKKRANCR